MGLFVNSLQLLERRVGVNLRGGGTGMPQQTPNTFYACAIVEHRRCKRVPQHMRRQLFLRANHLQVGHHLLPHPATIHPFAFLGEKQSVAKPRHMLVAHGDIPPERISDLVAEWYDALLVALASDLHMTCIVIHLPIIKPNKLGDSHPRLVECDDYGPGAHVPVGIAPRARVKQLVHLALFQEVRKRLPFLWGSHIVSRVSPDQAP